MRIVATFVLIACVGLGVVFAVTACAGHAPGPDGGMGGGEPLGTTAETATTVSTTSGSGSSGGMDASSPVDASSSTASSSSTGK